MKILIYRLGSMGDTLVALPCLHAIRRNFPRSHITWLTYVPTNIKARASADLLANTGLVDDYMSYPVGTRKVGELVRLIWGIYQRQFDLVIHLAALRGLPKTWRDFLFFNACGIRNIAGLPWRSDDHRNLPDPHNPGLYEPEARRLARRLFSLLGPIDLADPQLWSLQLTSEEIQKAHALLTLLPVRGNYVVVSIGTKMPSKDWEQANWLIFLAAFARRFPHLTLLTIGSPDEAERSEELVAGWTGQAFNLAGRLTVRQSAAILRGAKAFIGHDSGPMHLAASENVPCVAIFSARSPPGQWFPVGKNHRIFYHQTDCFGCKLEVCTVERKKCILSITVEDVLAGASALVIGNEKSN